MRVSFAIWSSEIPLDSRAFLKLAPKLVIVQSATKRTPRVAPRGEGGMVEKSSLYAKRVKFQETMLRHDSVRDQRADALAALQRSALHYCQLELPFRHPADTNGVGLEIRYVVRL